VTFYLSQSPSDKLTGELEYSHLSAEAGSDKGNTVRLLVNFDQVNFRDVIKEPKVNSPAIAKVYCGKKPIGYVYLHDLVDFIRAKILFRL
jgi:hypothetical protein